MWIIAWLGFFKSFFLVLVKSVLQKYQKISSLQQRDFYRIKTYYIEYFLVFFLMDFIVNYPINSESNLKKPWFYQCFLSVSIPLLWFHQKIYFFHFYCGFFFTMECYYLYFHFLLKQVQNRHRYKSFSLFPFFHFISWYVFFFKE